MLGKIVRLNVIPESTNSWVQDGLPRTCKGTYQSHNTQIKFECMASQSDTAHQPFTQFHGGYRIIDQGNGVKEILISDNNKDEGPDESDKYTLLVLIEFGWFDSNAKKISGIDQFEGVLEMHPGDTITVAKGVYYPHVIFEVTKNGNELFLRPKKN